LQSTSGPNEQSTDQPGDNKVQGQKKLVEELKVQWKQLWTERFDDKERAEGVSVSDYNALYIEQGTVIHATKQFKALNFQEILEQHKVENPERYIQPDANAGGWNKFIKKQITNSPSKKTKSDTYVSEKPKGKQPKKCGRGWLHST
jgi:ABC-type sulfate transport system substrate-binding protein